MREAPITLSGRVRALARSVSMVAAALAVGFFAPAPVRAQPPEADPDGQQTAEEAMQGGGMTEEQQLDDQAARQHFRVATRYYDEGRFQEAAQQFEEAYQLSGRAELLYNAYIAHREANQLTQARAMLERYLDEVPDAPDRVNLEARLVQLQRAVEEEEARQRQLAEARERAAQEAERRRQAESAPEAWPWVVMGVGGAVLAAGAILGGVALGEAGDLAGECDETGLCPPDVDIEGRRSSAENVAIAADVLLIGGGVVAATGLVLGLVFGVGQGGAQDTEDETQPEVGLACASSGCVGTLRGRF